MIRAGKVRFATLMLVIVVLSTSVVPVNAAAPSEFASASAAITSAFVAVNTAQTNGGNVTASVASLNVALGLYMQAQSENTANAAKASVDLQNATSIAQIVAADAPVFGQAGASAHQALMYESIGSAVVIVFIAAFVYIYGGWVYRRLWLRLYSEYLVKKVG